MIKLAVNGHLETVITVPLFNEYEEVLSRPEHHVGGWTERDSELLTASLLNHAEQIRPRFSYRPLTEDPADDLVLEAAINGQADIATFNVRHFKAASRFGVRVLKPAEVLKKLTEGES